MFLVGFGPISGGFELVLMVSKCISWFQTIFGDSKMFSVGFGRLLTVSNRFLEDLGQFLVVSIWFSVGFGQFLVISNRFRCFQTGF